MKRHLPPVIDRSNKLKRRFWGKFTKPLTSDKTRLLVLQGRSIDQLKNEAARPMGAEFFPSSRYQGKVLEGKNEGPEPPGDGGGCRKGTEEPKRKG